MTGGAGLAGDGGWGRGVREVVQRIPGAPPVQQLLMDPPQFRLRVGDWRYIFRRFGEDAIEVLRVRNRREVYR